MNHHPLLDDALAIILWAIAALIAIVVMWPLQRK
jgi:hypothetical protein